MTHTRALQALATSVLFAALTACGGGSDDDIKAVPTGGALANVRFADTNGYFPLDKLKSNGALYTGSEADFGPVNPAFSSGDKQNSQWSIDTSATVEGGYQLQYTMKLKSINASKTAVEKLKSNLRFNSSTGMITQYCSGFPNCYENTSGAEENFLFTVSAKVVGGKGELERNFIFGVR